ncbi:MAG: heavy metal translocating P-type ATPase [Pseudomonadota bacterium]
MTETVTLQVTGLHCASCVARAEKALSAVPGVTGARVNLATHTASADLASGGLPAALEEALASAGFGASLGLAAPDPAIELRNLRRNTIFAVVLTLPVFLIEMGGHLIPAVHHWVMANIGQTVSWWGQFLLCSIVIFGPGFRFLRTGLPALWRRVPDMNSLVALGALAAWGYSTVALVAPEIFPTGTKAVYFEAAAVIVSLILLGRFLEARAKGRAGDAIRSLMSLRPSMAEVQRGDGFEKVAIANLRIGDVVQIRPGGRVPADGNVVSGASYVDEAMLTGEPEPRAKAAGDAVTGGTVNGTGLLRVEISATGAASTLAQIISMVEAAQGAKLPMQRIIDRVTAVFVPVVMVVALLTAVVWFFINPSLAMVTAVSVMIIACPCAMGLATPISIVVGIGRAARLGVFFRKGEALQGLSQIGVVAFDKTGTLTVGRPEVTQATYTPGQESTLPLIAAVEAGSEHPLAQALVTFAGETGRVPAVTGFEAVSGKGVKAKVSGQTVQVGSAAFLADNKIDLGPLEHLAETARVFAAIDGAPVAAFEIADEVRKSAVSVIAGLKAQGLQVAMITGDGAANARRAAEALGIAEVRANVLPGGKQDALRELRLAHGPVAFVGDGINDAPALADADVGIAMGGGTDVAIESADIVLMGNDLRGVVTAHRVAKATMSNIRQNLFWAFAYNAALIPLAAGVAYPMLLSPMLAAGAMAASSVCVVANALRLRKVGGEA